jgi:hypothetical protein
MKKGPTRNCLIQVRLTPDEMSRMRALMELYGYRAQSCFLRDVINRKQLRARPKVDSISGQDLLDKVNILIYQVNKIGVNYNQVVALWQKQSGQTRPDGTPYMNTRSVESRLAELMRMTEGLRDEFAVLLDVIRKYTDESRDSTTI